MFEIIFGAFFMLMMAEVGLFLFLNLPFPKSWKSAIFRSVAEKPALKTFLKVQLLLCILAGLFYYEMSTQERQYVIQKNKLKSKTSFGAGSNHMIQIYPYLELRKSTLSYQILKIQRNKYINFLVIFTFAITVAFFWIKQHRYELEEKYKVQLAALEKIHPEYANEND